MKPILFNAEMVKAILDGRKTVTRRVVKFPPGQTGRLPECGAKDYLFYPCGIKYPPYLTGDILYVRETWTQDGDVFRYKAGFYDQNRKWKPSIHMPREAARIFLRVTDVRVERLQDMRLADCIAEGVLLSTTEKGDCVRAPLKARERYAGVWDNTIKKSDRSIYGWDANPWVWVIEFEKISKEAANGLDTP